VNHYDNLYLAKLAIPIRPIPNNIMLMGSEKERPMVSVAFVIPAVALTQKSRTQANPITKRVYFRAFFILLSSQNCKLIIPQWILSGGITMQSNMGAKILN
jgi:hypothetical protein